MKLERRSEQAQNTINAVLEFAAFAGIIVIMLAGVALLFAGTP